jgi:hypothetical protein
MMGNATTPQLHQWYGIMSVVLLHDVCLAVSSLAHLYMVGCHPAAAT